MAREPPRRAAESNSSSHPSFFGVLRPKHPEMAEKLQEVQEESKPNPGNKQSQGGWTPETTRDLNEAVNVDLSELHEHGEATAEAFFHSASIACGKTTLLQKIKEDCPKGEEPLVDICLDGKYTTSFLNLNPFQIQRTCQTLTNGFLRSAEVVFY